MMYGVTLIKGVGFQPWAYEVPGQPAWKSGLSPALWATQGMPAHWEAAAALAMARDAAERMTERYAGDWEIVLVEASETTTKGA